MAHSAMDTQALASETLPDQTRLSLIEIRLPDKFLALQRAGKTIETIEDSDKVTIFQRSFMLWAFIGPSLRLCSRPKLRNGHSM